MDADAEVILFGSRARGDNDADSDWDLLILTDLERTVLVEDGFRDVVYDLELKHEQVFSMFLFSKSQWSAGASPSPLYDNIREEGLVL